MLTVDLSDAGDPKSSTMLTMSACGKYQESVERSDDFVGLLAYKYRPHPERFRSARYAKSNISTFKARAQRSQCPFVRWLGEATYSGVIAYAGRVWDLRGM